MTKQTLFKISKLSYIIVLIFAFLAGAAMALEPAVAPTAKALGTTGWVMALVFIVWSSFDALVLTSIWPEWLKIREGEKGFKARIAMQLLVSLIVFILIVTSLSLAGAAF